MNILSMQPLDAAQVLVECEYFPPDPPVNDVESPWVGPGTPAVIEILGCWVNNEFVSSDYFNNGILAYWREQILKERETD